MAAIDVPAAMSNNRLPLAIASIALLSVACAAGGAASPGGSAGPSAAPSSAGGVDQPTGPTDLVLRLEEGGGFVPIEFMAGSAPIFTLYGDGRVVFQQQTAVFPEPDAAGIVRSNPWRTAQLDAEQIEELLTFALGPGGLGAARDNYGNDMVADASTSTFTINAGGVDKKVAIYALGMEGEGVADVVARRAFQTLADRLRDFDDGGSISTDVYAPAGYRAVLVEREDTPPNAIAWPWPDLTLDDFKADINGEGSQQFPHRAMTPDEIAALNMGDVSGGMQGAALKGPDGKTYSFILRPLLPDETE